MQALGKPHEDIGSTVAHLTGEASPGRISVHMFMQDLRCVDGKSSDFRKGGLETKAAQGVELLNC